MEKWSEGERPSLKEYSPLTLAFLGDGVYEVMVRDYLVRQGNCPVKKLHSRAVAWVRCETQHRALKEVLWPLLTEEEREMAQRGRNAHVGHVPKNASVEDYHGATAFETLWGWLYLQGETVRLEELFAAVAQTMEME